MIAFLRGILKEKGQDSVIVEVDGVGYELFLSANAIVQLPELNQEVKLCTYLYMRDDLIQLYGFTSPSEKEMFIQLISVSKIGPKSALAALSTFSADAIRKAIAMNDIELVSSIPGIGKKTAQRLVLELREKVRREKISVLSVEEDSKVQEVRNALINLGYSQAEANRALENTEVDSISAEELLKRTLHNLGKSIKKA